MSYDESASDFNEIEFLLRASTNQLFKNSDPESFLDWIADAGPVLAQQLSAQVNPDTGSIGWFFRALGVQIYNNTPQVDNSFRVRPLPKPERNQPCYCGSGQKYKHCCLSTEKHSSPLDSVNMLRYVLDLCSKRIFVSLPASQVDTEALADVAIQWLDQGDVQRTQELLEPWFKPAVVLNHRQLPLFDILMDIYLNLDKPLKRKRLLERACDAKDKQLRAEAWRRKATMEMDQGDVEAAWSSFSVAQKLAPDSPPLALLEMSLLCASHQPEQAKARATFWLARFRRARNVSAEFIDLLEQCTRDPAAALFHSVAESKGINPELQALDDMLHAAPAPTICYRLDLFDSGEAMLESNTSLSKLEQRWHKAAEPNKPSLTHTQNNDLDFWVRSNQWMSVLQNNPALWNSFLVLDDLVMGVDALLAEGMFLENKLTDLLIRLVERADEVLERQLSQAPANLSWTLPWGMLENRPILRLQAHRLYLLENHRGLEEAYLQQAERLLRLNPNDNHGIRHELSTAYLTLQQPDKALALAERYPDDVMCILPLNSLLALYQTNQQPKAAQYLQKIAPRFEIALDMLLAKAPRQPQMSEHGMRLGGKDEAWLYRETTHNLWKSSGGLVWLKQAIKAL